MTKISFYEIFKNGVEMKKIGLINQNLYFETRNTGQATVAMLTNSFSSLSFEMFTCETFTCFFPGFFFFYFSKLKDAGLF